MQSAKETAANVAASAKAGMEKTKATAQEKAERMTTRDPLQKEMATEKKEERIHEAERQKLEARDQNAAARQTGGGIMGHEYTTGAQQQPMAGSGGTAGYPHGTTTATGGTAGYPHGTTTATGGTTGTGVHDPREGFGSGVSSGVGAEDPNVAGGRRTGYGAGGTM